MTQETFLSHQNEISENSADWTEQDISYLFELFNHYVRESLSIPEKLQRMFNQIPNLPNTLKNKQE